MLRALAPLLFACACAPLAAPAPASPSTAPAIAPAPAGPSLARVEAAPRPLASRLQPPFGAAAGVRRIAPPTETPAVVAVAGN